MKRVLVIGAGPIGLTCAHILSKTLNVTVASPNSELSLESTSKQLKFKNNLIRDAIWGDANIWGNQHDLSLNYLGIGLSISDLPNIRISEQEIQKEIKILNEAWVLRQI